MSTQPPQAGLYGSRVGAHRTRAALGELVGTFIFLYAGCSVAVAAALEKPVAGAPYSSLSVALAFGLVLVALVSALGHVSGCHLNPAVTLGLAATRKFPIAAAPLYIAAQIVGALLSSLAVWLTYGSAAREAPAKLAATALAPGVGLLQGLAVEALTTFILVFVVISVATDPRVEAATAGIAVGFALIAGIFIGGPVTGGSLNPARSLGPAVVAGTYSDIWIYLVGPVVGGVAAAFLYASVIGKAELEEVVGDEAAA
ncbi:MAG: MIP/aquaporin family protein [Thermoleophilaceae bacterium]